MLMSYLVKQRTGHMEKKDKSKNKEGMYLPGGTRIWFGWGCATGALKPVPIFKGSI